MARDTVQEAYRHWKDSEMRSVLIYAKLLGNMVIYADLSGTMVSIAYALAMAIGQTVVEIRQFNGFQNGGRRKSWSFKNSKFQLPKMTVVHHLGFVVPCLDHPQRVFDGLDNLHNLVGIHAVVSTICRF